MKQAVNPPLSLAGHTMRWKFTEGPTAGTTYEHTFRPDGTVVWRDVKSDARAKPRAKATPKKKTDSATHDQATHDAATHDAATHYASFEIANGLHLVSYLSAESGYT